MNILLYLLEQFLKSSTFLYRITFLIILFAGKVRVLFPGLSGPVMKDKKVASQEFLPPNPEYEEKILKARDTMGKFKPMKLTTLERGWSGTKFHGRKLGAPYSETEG